MSFRTCVSKSAKEANATSIRWRPSVVSTVVSQWRHSRHINGSVDLGRCWQLPSTTDQKPHLLGVMTMFYIPVEEYNRLERQGTATNVQKRAADKQLAISKRVISEREFSFFGYLPCKYLQSRWEIPLLQCETVDNEWKTFYNITDPRQPEFLSVRRAVENLVKARASKQPLANLLKAVRKAFMTCCEAKVKFDLGHQHPELGVTKLLVS